MKFFCPEAIGSETCVLKNDSIKRASWSLGDTCLVENAAEGAIIVLHYPRTYKNLDQVVGRIVDNIDPKR